MACSFSAFVVVLFDDLSRFGEFLFVDGCALASAAARRQKARIVAASLPPNNSCNNAEVAVILKNSTAISVVVLFFAKTAFIFLFDGKCLANSSFAPHPSKKDLNMECNPHKACLDCLPLDKTGILVPLHKHPLQRQKEPTANPDIIESPLPDDDLLFLITFVAAVAPVAPVAPPAAAPVATSPFGFVFFSSTSVLVFSLVLFLR